MAMTNSGIILTTVEEVLSWGRRNSLWPVSVGLACCAIEMMHTAASRFDTDRIGIIFRGSPRQSDVLIVAGTVVNKVAPMLRLIYEQMPDPNGLYLWAVVHLPEAHFLHIQHYKE